eukprot:15433624-Alexandrium_andersonii.AAC.1
MMYRASLEIAEWVATPGEEPPSSCQSPKQQPPNLRGLLIHESQQLSAEGLPLAKPTQKPPKCSVRTADRPGPAPTT